MKQSEVAKWLKVITIITGIVGLIFFLCVLPMLVKDVAGNYPQREYLTPTGILYGWCIAIICYGALYQFWKVCVQIGKNNSFSQENAKAFANISRLAVLLAVLWFGGIGYLALVHCFESVFIIVIALFAFVCIVIAVLAAALSHLILKAYEMKQENELTI